MPAPTPAPLLAPAARDQFVDTLHFDAAGLLPVVARQFDSSEVLMLAWMNPEAVRRTLETGLATYWSRSRRDYWVKGATSGNWQVVRAVRVDCDADTLLLDVDQTGVACHTGTRTCFDDGLIADADRG